MMIKIIIYSDGYDSKNDKKMMKKKRLKINGTVLLTFCFENTEK